MFGRSLAETMAVEVRLGGTYIPVLVHRCSNYIRDHGRYCIYKCNDSTHALPLHVHTHILICTPKHEAHNCACPSIHTQTSTGKHTYIHLVIQHKQLCNFPASKYSVPHKGSLVYNYFRCYFHHTGLMETGIFRLPGQSSRVQALKEIYDQGVS